MRTLQEIVKEMETHKEAEPFVNFAAIALEHAIKPFIEDLREVKGSLEALRGKWGEISKRDASGDGGYEIAMAICADELGRIVGSDDNLRCHESTQTT